MTVTQSEQHERMENGGNESATAAKGRSAATRQARGTRPAPRAGGRATRGANARVESERELLIEISAKLDRLVAVMATQGRDRDTQVAILAAAGCDSAFVASLVGMSPGAVRKLPSWRRIRGDGAGATPEEAAR